MRKDYIEIDGKKVRVEANWNALTAFLAATGRNTMDGLSDLATMKPTDIAPLMAACANEGERLEDVQLCVKEVFVDCGRMLKRIQAAPQGRAHRIRKRSNHVTLVVDKMVTAENK